VDHLARCYSPEPPSWQAEHLDYWNHNSAFHPMILRVADELSGDVLDVGCGEGLLVERLAEVSRHVRGIDKDEEAIRQAQVRTRQLDNADLKVANFMEMDVDPESYDLITFVAVIHHMDFGAALLHTSRLLRPGGQLVIVGLSTNKSLWDYTRSALLLPLIRLMSSIHHETRSVQVAVLPPKESFSDLKKIARRQLPGSRLRRALYCRYILRWSKPQQSSG
jgi:2-polyprenyl-3-methyl-5-hydroxy-6-metoxy-1,4-benzoquinol methylase